MKNNRIPLLVLGLVLAWLGMAAAVGAQSVLERLEAEIRQRTGQGGDASPGPGIRPAAGRPAGAAGEFPGGDSLAAGRADSAAAPGQSSGRNVRVAPRPATCTAEGDRIAQLQRRIEQLERRVEELEKTLKARNSSR